MAKQKRASLDWLVAARGYGMYCVFTTHLMGTYLFEHGITEYKTALAYSEPVVLSFFAILTGAFYVKPKNTFKDYFRLKFGQRVFPVYLYLLMVIPLIFLFATPEQPATEALKLIPLHLLGIPLLSWSSWFLVAMFTCEVLLFFLFPLARKSSDKLVLALLCYTLVWAYQHYVRYFPTAGMIGMAWMLQASLLFCAFYLFGSYMKPYILKIYNLPVVYLIILTSVAIALTMLAINSNTYFTSTSESSYFIKLARSQERIVFSTGQYGNYFWFMLATLAGALSFTCVCRMIPVTRFMRACGDHSLELIGLSGLFLGGVNHHLAAALVPPQDNYFICLLYPMVLGLLQMAICLPIAMLLSKWLPQLTGKPMLKGPILPALYMRNNQKDR